MKQCPTCRHTYPNDYAVCPRDSTELLEASLWREGSIKGKYRILGKLGEGGMGAVYKAVHLRFNEVRALKVMNAELAGKAAFVKRFEREALAARRLQHPNAVRVDDIDVAEDGSPFIVMEFIEGRSLSHLIRSEAPLFPARVCLIIKQVAAALDAAHRLGIVHRDIKPDNIALLDSPSGEQAKVLDFGIAKLREEAAGEVAGTFRTATGTLLGTPQYMSPEQAKGMPGDQLDGRADLYSLGVVMYEMLAGALPFKADTIAAWILAHLQTPPIPVRTVISNVRVPDSLASLVMQLLEKDRERRPLSGAAVIGAIEEAEAEIKSEDQRLMARLEALEAELEDWHDLYAAIAEFMEFIRLNPDDDFARHMLEIVTSGDLEGIIGELRAAIHLQPDEPHYHNMLAGALKKKGNQFEAAQQEAIAKRLLAKRTDRREGGKP